MVRTRILIVDPDSGLSQGVCDHLLASGFDARTLVDGRDTRFLKQANHPHLVIVDLAAPGMEGFGLVSAIRRESSVPVVVTSSRNDLEERLAGFDAGADDFLVKPVERRELVARVKSILRRSSVRESRATDADAREWHFQGLVIQSLRRRVLLDGAGVELTTAEFDILRLFATHAQQVLSRELILDQLRGLEWEAVDRSIDILVSRLRDKLNDHPRRPRFIRTVRSVGYQFIAEAITEPAAPSA